MPCAAQAEDKIVNNTREVCPGVILTGMELAETVLPRPPSRLLSYPLAPLPCPHMHGLTPTFAHPPAFHGRITVD